MKRDLIILAALVLIGGCDRSSATAVSPHGGGDVASAGAMTPISPTQVEMFVDDADVMLAENQLKSVEIRYRNTDTTSHRVLKVSKTCGCVSAQATPETVDAGGELVVRVSLTGPSDGERSVQAIVAMDDNQVLRPTVRILAGKFTQAWVSSAKALENNACAVVIQAIRPGGSAPPLKPIAKRGVLLHVEDWKPVLGAGGEPTDLWTINVTIQSSTGPVKDPEVRVAYGNSDLATLDTRTAAIYHSR